MRKRTSGIVTVLEVLRQDISVRDDFEIGSGVDLVIYVEAVR